MTSKRRPSQAERDERVKVELPADQFIKGVMDAGPADDEQDDDDTDAGSGT